MSGAAYPVELHPPRSRICTESADFVPFLPPVIPYQISLAYPRSTCARRFPWRAVFDSGTGSESNYIQTSERLGWTCLGNRPHTSKSIPRCGTFELNVPIVPLVKCSYSRNIVLRLFDLSPNRIRFSSLALFSASQSHCYASRCTPYPSAGRVMSIV